MNVRSWLNLTTVQVERATETADGMGAATVTTVLTTLSRSAIWQAGSGDRFLSDKIAQASTHVLVLETDTYTWASTDTTVVYGGNTYNLVGTLDDVANLSRITSVGLELIK